MKRIEHRSIKRLQLATLILPLVAFFSLTSCGGPSVPKADLMNALKKSIPDGLELTDVSYEVAPTQNGQNSAMMHVKAKITATATQDLYSKPTDPADIKAANDYINFYNGNVNWTNALQQTSYADELNRDKPKIDNKVPTFLHRDQLKGDTFTGYCDVIAEHQVDRWIFSPIQGIDWGDKKPGSASARFGPNCVGANAPDGQTAAKQFVANEDAMTAFRKQFAAKHTAESGPIVQALKPLLTGGQEFQTLSVKPGQEIPNVQWSFSEYDPQTNRFRVKWRSIMGGGMGPGEIVGPFILIFYDATQYGPAGVTAVGSYDPQTGDLTLHQKNQDPEVLHTRHK